jgi:hypothetical protein
MAVNIIFSEYIVACNPITRQRVGKSLPSEAEARKNTTSIARQRSSTQSNEVYFIMDATVLAVGYLLSLFNVPRFITLKM